MLGRCLLEILAELLRVHASESWGQPVTRVLGIRLHSTALLCGRILVHFIRSIQVLRHLEHGISAEQANDTGLQLNWQFRDNGGCALMRKPGKKPGVLTLIQLTSEFSYDARGHFI